MRKISVWARNHRLAAISCIVMLKLLLALIAYYVGTSLSKLGIDIPFPVLAATMIVFLATAMFYPSRNRQKTISKNLFYTWQKTCDFVIAACTFVMIATLINSNMAATGTTEAYASHVTTITEPTAEEILASLKYRGKSSLTKQEKRILKTEFKKQLKVYVAEKVKGNKDGAGKAGLIILTIIGALGLLYLVAALACSLSCNGSDAAAVIVGILGVALIVWGTIALIKRISRGKKKNDDVAPETK